MIDAARARELVLAHGWNTTSFRILDARFHRFFDGDEAVDRFQLGTQRGSRVQVVLAPRGVRFDFEDHGHHGNVPSTGSVNVLANLVNILNSWSSSLGAFRLGIINIFGSAAPAATADATGDQNGTQALPENLAVGVNADGPIAATVNVNPLAAAKKASSAGGTGSGSSSSDASAQDPVAILAAEPAKQP